LRIIEAVSEEVILQIVQRDADMKMGLSRMAGWGWVRVHPLGLADYLDRPIRLYANQLLLIEICIWVFTQIGFPTCI